uniref:Gamma-glutamyltransferase 7 n=1 Tax=Oreochromis niloticus TaxID=8128 RepID=I3KWT6_ORENI
KLRPCGDMVRMEASPEAKLNKQSTLGYKSFGSSYQLFKFALKTQQISTPFKVVFSSLAAATAPLHLKQLAPNGTNLFDQSPSNLKETGEDCSSRGTPIPVYALSTIFAIGVTIALVLQIYLGEIVFGSRCGCLPDICLFPHCRGGIMLVHDIHRNETRVINFLGSAPKAFRTEALHNVSQAGLQVGVPGMLRGLQRAHTLYGGVFRHTIMIKVTFYTTDLIKLSLFSSCLHLHFVILALEFIIQVPPPPSAGAVLLSALSLLDGLHISKSNVTETQTRLWIVEALKTALAMACGLGDPNYNSSVTEVLSNMLSKSQAEVFGQQLNYSHTSPSEYLSPIHSTQTELVAGQVIVMGQDNLIVSVASSLSRPFGSRLITRSGIVLNSLIFDFSWPNTSRGQLQTNQENCVEPGTRPLSLLMPIIVVPASYKCGIHMAVSTSGEQNALSVITQMLVNVLFFHTEKNDSFSPTGLQHQFEPNKLLVRCEYRFAFCSPCSSKSEDRGVLLSPTECLS